MKQKIEHFISNNPIWRHESNELVTRFEMKDFAEVQTAVNKIMKIAGELNHHPTVTFSYNFIEVKTTTHDAENSVTDKDLALAEEIAKAIS